MEMKITSIVPTKLSYQKVDLFAYSTKGVPGLEIVGLPKGGRALKEKLIFLTKIMRIRIPPKRFVICLEGELDASARFSYLELPILLLFWSLAGRIKVDDWENCVSSGIVDLMGNITSLKYDERVIEILDSEMDDYKIISSGFERILSAA